MGKNQWSLCKHQLNFGGSEAVCMGAMTSSVSDKDQAILINVTLQGPSTDGKFCACTRLP